jgi:hypothetical protein
MQDEESCLLQNVNMNTLSQEVSGMLWQKGEETAIASIARLIEKLIHIWHHEIWIKVYYKTLESMSKKASE